MSDKNGILLEEVRHMFQAIREGQVSMAHMPKKLDVIDARLDNLESDVSAIKEIAKSYGFQINDHEPRITDLEAI